MKINGPNKTLQCFPCFIRQMIDAARFTTDDPLVQERIIRNVLSKASEMDFQQSAPEVAQWVHRLIRSESGNSDPYLEGKRHSNEVMLRQFDYFKQLILESASPWDTAVRIAIGGNTVDFAFRNSFTPEYIRETMQLALKQPIFGVDDGQNGADPHPDVEMFRRDVESARSILYVLDNAGEIVCDRVFIETLLPIDRTTAAVRGGPILNDALMEDAAMVGLTDLLPVIHTGSDAPGVLLHDVNDEFREAYESADLIIAKGLANFETMVEYDRDIWFLFKAKCTVIADIVGEEIGSLVIRRNRAS